MIGRSGDSLQNLKKRPFMKHWKNLILWVSLTSILCSADLVVDGNLTVNQQLEVLGDASVWGNTLELGHFSNIPEVPGLRVLYEEVGANGKIFFRQGRGAARWSWQKTADGVIQTQMCLDPANVLTIGSGSAMIQMDPGQGFIQVNGRRVIFSDQIPLGSSTNSTALALGLGTLSNAGGSMAIGYGAKATGYGSLAFGISTESLTENSVAVGSFAKATGFQSFALGSAAYASGFRSFSLGQDSTALGSGAVAIGSGSSAQSDGSLAVGGNQHATGYGSGAIGMNTTVSGELSYSIGNDNAISYSDSFVLGRQTAVGAAFSYALGHGNSVTAISGYCFGEGMTVQTAGETVVGRYNQAIANGNSSDPQGLLFTVGNGASNTQRSNALEIKKNGNTKLYGDFALTGVARMNPAGDLSMGEFTAGTQP